MHEVDTSGLPIGRALKVERVAAGVSSTAVAADVGISIGHLSRIESGERTAHPEMVTKIRAAIRSEASLDALEDALINDDHGRGR